MIINPFAQDKKTTPKKEASGRAPPYYHPPHSYLLHSFHANGDTRSKLHRIKESKAKKNRGKKKKK